MICHGRWVQTIQGARGPFNEVGDPNPEGTTKQTAFSPTFGALLWKSTMIYAASNGIIIRLGLRW